LFDLDYNPWSDHKEISLVDKELQKYYDVANYTKSYRTVVS